MRAAAGSARGVTMIGAGTETRLSYGELFARADRIAAGLLARGVGPGERVVIVLPQGLELVATFLACLAMGAIPSILPPVSPKQEPRLYWRDMDALLTRIQARLLVTFEAYAADAHALMPTAGDQVAMAADLAASEAAPAPAWHEPAPGDVAFLQHSSGTTAVKKGVMITHAAAVEQLRAYGACLELSPDDRVVSWLPLYHDMGLIACFLLPVLAGLDLVTHDTFEWVASPGLLLETVQASRASLAWLPNFAFQHLCDAVDPDRRFDLSSLRAVINCSETCRPATMQAFVDRFAPCGLDPAAVQTCYAMAETVFAVSQSRLGDPPRVLCVDRPDFAMGEPVTPCPPDQAARRLASCGPLLQGVECRVLDAAGGELGEGVVGQIAVRAPFLFTGYYRLPHETQAAFADGWCLTGDLGLMLDGELYVTGRLKDMLIIHGKNIMAHDVEAAVAGAAGVKPGRVVALGVFDPRLGSDNLVVVAELEDALLDPAAARAEVKRRVVQTLGLTVSRVRIAPPGWIVKSTSGKLNRKENLQKLADPALGGLLV
jgi:acyl-CoA synthetase (AMP-forming)/AMP-acid ligase II